MGKIMIADDEVELLSLYTEMFKIFGHDVISTVANGDEAIDTYEKMEERPDLIIIDHRMPIRNGLETAAEILKINPDEKIIFVSADLSVKSKALEMGAMRFIEKPDELQTQRRTIDEIL